MCAAANKTGFYEPVREHPPPTPHPPPAPAPAPLGAAYEYVRNGLCLSVVDGQTGDGESAGHPHLLRMGNCSLGDDRAVFRQGFVRGLPTLESVYLRHLDSQHWCVNIGVYPNNMTCRYDHQLHLPHLRQCSDGTSHRGGNPVGCGFNFQNETIRSLSCVDATDICIGSGDGVTLLMVPCEDVRARGWTRRSNPFYF